MQHRAEFDRALHCLAADDYDLDGDFDEDGGYGPSSFFGGLFDDQRNYLDPDDPDAEARRREIIDLGFPDDGYDYLKHLRVLGRGRANLDMPASRPR